MIMTNYEHYREQIEKIARIGRVVAVNKDKKPCVCCITHCEDCIAFDAANMTGKTCYEVIDEWADEEYIEQEVDWSKVAVDTPILVSDDIENWYCRHFAKYENGLVYAWDAGKTSYTTDATITWEYAKLANEN